MFLFSGIALTHIMDDELNVESTLNFSELNGDFKNVVSNEESKHKKMTMTTTSPTQVKLEPVDHIVVLTESTIDGSNSQRHHLIRSSIANLTQTIHEEAHAINKTENITKLIKFYTVVTLVVIICGMVVLFSVPFVLYLTELPIMESRVIDGASFKSCTVSE